MRRIVGKDDEGNVWAILTVGDDDMIVTDMEMPDTDDEIVQAMQRSYLNRRAGSVMAKTANYASQWNWESDDDEKDQDESATS